MLPFCQYFQIWLRLILTCQNTVWHGTHILDQEHWNNTSITNKELTFKHSLFLWAALQKTHGPIKIVPPSSSPLFGNIFPKCLGTFYRPLKLSHASEWVKDLIIAKNCFSPNRLLFKMGLVHFGWIKINAKWSWTWACTLQQKDIVKPTPLLCLTLINATYFYYYLTQSSSSLESTFLMDFVNFVFIGP